jgi:hypothetical protein
MIDGPLKMIDDALKYFSGTEGDLRRYHAGLCDDNRGQCELNQPADFDVMKYREYHQQ